MKKKCLLFLLITINLLNAQEETIRNSVSAGFHIAQYQRDFALGIDLTSPFFAGRHGAVRLRANVPFNEHASPGGHITWTPYGSISAGFVGVGGVIADRIRLYGEGGLLMLLPSGEFSSKVYEMGGYGLFGFEFFILKNFNYHIEIGGAGTGATADKIPGHPIYSNGMIIQAGFRTQF